MSLGSRSGIVTAHIRWFSIDGADVAVGSYESLGWREDDTRTLGIWL